MAVVAQDIAASRVQNPLPAAARRGEGLPNGLRELLRLACCAEFIGHGAFGIITKAAWVPYFGVAGIQPANAFKLMPLVGSVDISLGVLALVRPMRWPLLYMACWGLWTALLRPLSGESGWETVERAPNYLVPLTLFALMRPTAAHAGAILARPLAQMPQRSLTIQGWLLRLATAGTCLGHGAYGMCLAKAGWYPAFAHLGLERALVDQLDLIAWVGGVEMAMGALVLLWSPSWLLIGIVAFKFGVELAWQSALPHWGFEVLERTANYVAPLALVLVQIMKAGSRDDRCSATGG